MKNKELNFNNAKEYFKNLDFIYYLLFFGQALFLVVSFYFKPTPSDTDTLNQLFQIIVPIYTFAIIILAPLIYVRILIRNMVQQHQLKEKLMVYRSANVIKFALLEGATLFAGVALLLTGNTFYIYIYIAMMLAFYIHRPQLEKCIRELNLNEKEAKTMRNNLPIA